MADELTRLTFTEAAKLTPGRPHRSSLFRWHSKGITTPSGQRVHLRCERYGGRLFTTLQWLREFSQSFAEANRKPNQVAKATEPSHHQQRSSKRDIERAQSRLHEAGI